MSNEEIIWKFLSNIGLNDYAVAGLMGNLYAESGLKSAILQTSYCTKLGYTSDSYTAAVDDGTYTNFVKDSAGYGLAQWTYWSRKQALLDYATKSSTSIGDLTMQLGYLWKELQGYTGVMKVLDSATSVREVSDVVLTQFEKPADQSETVQVKRASYGQVYYDKYASTSSVTEITTATTVTSDVPAWAKTLWEYSTEKGYTDGTRANDACTRAESMAMILKVLSRESIITLPFEL